MSNLRSKYKRNRRGITLLFVVSMIVLFLLMGTTFVIVSHDYLADASRRGRQELRVVRAPVSIQNILYEFIRGPSLLNSSSPLRGHSLLGDQYGYGYEAYIQAAAPAAGTDGQMFEIRLKDGYRAIDRPRVTQNAVRSIAYDPEEFNGPPSITLESLSGGVPGFFNGQILSVVTGPAAGTSTRIVDHRIDGADHVFVVIPEWFDNNAQGLGALENARVILNGRPFSGYGAGANLSPTGASINQSALLPNFRSFETPNGANVADRFFEDYVRIDSDGSGNITNLSGTVSVNEDYDSFDWNNMFLGGIVSNTERIASFNRPELERAANVIGGVSENRYSFRPVLGSTANDSFPNINFPFANRPLDVDNLVTGVNDSVWIDIGLPIQSNDSGRLVKPLVAALILELDSRLNVNAHGSLVDANSADNLQLTRLQMLNDPINVPHGLGMGPAEVSLRSLGDGFVPTANPAVWDYSKLLIGNASFDGRYGPDDRPGLVGRDTWSRVRFPGYPDTSLNNSTNGFVGGVFTSSPMDLHGRFGYGFPNQRQFGVPVGMPMADVNISNWIGGGEIVDSPYETNLLDTTSDYNDDLYTPHELERVLRFADVDSAYLPGRLSALIPDAARGQLLVTTDSYEVPRAPMVPASAANSRAFQTVPTRLYGLLTNYGGLTSQQARSQMEKMLAPEVLRGLRMNVNRMFGDGQDNDGDDVFDEHWKDNPPNPAINESRSETVVDYQGTNVAFDHDNDGYPQSNIDYLSRQIFARQLFTLVWIATGQEKGNVIDPPDMNGDGMNDSKDIRALAQWCVNVVDFRDPDAINTPFEYDLNPFNGWDVDGEIDPAVPDTDSFGMVLDPQTDKGVVWGAERPELLITEALGTHDRKSEDLPNGGGVVGSGDTDYDSDAVPVASCFIELFAPNLTSSNSQKLHAELYSAGGIDLTQSASTNENVPVWRLAITKDQGDSPMGDGARRVYFVKPSNTVGNGEPAEDGVNENFYFPNSNISIDRIFPNSYAVIGSGGIEYNDGGRRVYRTTFGRRTDAFVDHTTMHATTDLDIDNTRAIRLIPGQGVEIQEGDSNNTESRSCVAIPINRSGHVSLPGFSTDGDGAIRSLGISDPDIGYVDALQVTNPGIIASPMAPRGIVSEGDCYILDRVLDRPVDAVTGHDFNLFDDGTHGDYRWVALQRLANPQAPHDPIQNPYLTVDESPIDLVVFNGSTPGDEPGLPAPPDDVLTAFKTVERGDTDNSPPGGRPARQRRLLWQPVLSSEPPTQDRRGNQVQDHIFDYEFFESYGEMNEPYRDVAFQDVAWPALSWNNRPFVSQYELALVPGGSGRKLFGPHRPGDERPNTSPEISTFEILQNFTLPGATYDATTSSRHLLPFNDTPNNNLFKLFDFLEVPSRFVGTELYLNPIEFDQDTSTTKTKFNPPYNAISRYRNPGKININTVLNPEIWNAFIGDFATTGSDRIEYSDLVASRRGAGSLSDFDRPFRANGMGQFVPQNSSGNPLIIQPYENQETFFSRTELKYSSNEAFNDTQRNAVFANDPWSRFGNIATNRSSVFAIWITVGYFEVDEFGLLGAEVVDEKTNQTYRPKAFFIYDRSIPVAFEPGSDHNVERGILVQTILD